ncbi:hypothetical protein HanPI659440_Chr01g0020241 [Helianthus annuus]|nr:hypothetical protein HanPI659440_Chr01g0020241 [Helianthus annuus]
MGINRWRFPILFSLLNFKLCFFSLLPSLIFFISLLSFLYLRVILLVIMSTGVNPSTKKRKYKPRNPPGPDRAEINWKEEEFHNLVRDMGFHSEWGAQFPTPNSTALDAPPWYIALYAAYFREGNFRLPMTKFTAEVLTNYGLHISQINTLGLPRLTHFEFI